MLTSSQALEIGYSEVKRFPDYSKPGDIVVELKGSEFRVRFFFVVSEDRLLDHLVEVSIDSLSGKVLKTEDKGRVAGLKERSAAKDWQKFLSGKQAYDLAVAAIKGFDEFDKHGRLTTILRQDVYQVTFPLPPPEHLGTARPDYAMQVCIDARSGKVLEMLAGS